MFFGTYLLKNNIIEKDQLIETMALQLESLPSLIRVIKENKILDHEQLITLIDQTAGKEKTIMEVLTDQQLLPKKEIQSIYQKQFERGAGLAELLIKQEILSPKEVETHIRKYLDHKNVRPDIPSPPKKEIKTDRPLQETGILKFNMNGELIKVFNKNCYKKIKNKIKHLTTSNDPNALLKKIGRSFTLIVHADRIGQSTKIGDFLQIWVDAIDKIKENKTINWHQTGEGLKEALELSWEIKNQSIEHSYDQDLFSNHRYLNNIEMAKKISL